MRKIAGAHEPSSNRVPWQRLIQSTGFGDQVIIPGVIDSTTNFIEHPELVAQRIIRYARVVGKENVIAGRDCGFGTFARTNPTTVPEIVWPKPEAMAEGAWLASSELR